MKIIEVMSSVLNYRMNLGEKMELNQHRRRRVYFILPFFFGLILTRQAESSTQSCQRVFEVENSNPVANNYLHLSDEQSLRTFGVTKEDLKTLDVPDFMVNEYEIFSQLAGFLWWSPFNSPEKRLFFQDFVNFFSRRIMSASRMLTHVKTMVGDDITPEDVDDMKSKFGERFDYTLDKVDRLHIEFDMDDKPIENMATYMVLRAMIFIGEEFPHRPHFTYDVGDFFALSFFPYRKTLVESLRGDNFVPYLDMMKSRFPNYVSEIATEQETMAAIAYMANEIAGKSYNKEVLKSIIGAVKSPETDNDFALLNALRESSLYLISKAFREMEGDVGGIYLSQPQGRAVMKSFFITRLELPPRVASFLTSFVVYGHFGEMPIDWDVPMIRRLLNNNLSQQVGNFRRSLRPYIMRRKALETAIDENHEIRTPVYYPLIPGKRPNDLQQRNPNKRKNQPNSLAKENEDVGNINEIPVVSSNGKDFKLYQLVEYSNSLKKELKNLPIELVNRFHDSYLPEILVDPLGVAGTLSDLYPKNWFKYSMVYRGTQYRVAYKISGKSVEIISIGKRDHFYDRLKQRPK